MGFFRPNTLSEATVWLAENRASVVAGCTDVFPATEGPSLRGSYLDVTAIEELRGIGQSAEHWRIGAAATWTDIVRADLPSAFDGLKSAARQVGSVQIQNAGTIAGNLVNASPAADGAPCLLTLDASVELASKAGIRTLPIGDFLLGPGETALEEDEIVSAVRVPKASGRGRSTFLKLGARKFLVISISMVAARIVEDAGVITNAAIAVGACSAVASRLGAVEESLIGKSADDDPAAYFDDDMVTRYLSPIDDTRSDAGYRNVASVELVRRAIRTLTEAGRS